MKKISVIALALILVASVLSVSAEISGMSLEELYQLRQEVNNAISERIHAAYTAPEGKTVAELFPDPWLAKTIRDKTGLISVNDVVTQEKLDTVTSIRINGQTTEHIQVTTLEGIQYLRNLRQLEVWKQDNITEIPEWIGELTKLTVVSFRICPIKLLPDSICNLTDLAELNISDTEISALPEDIGNLSSLKTLNISNTSITKLPDSIRVLELTSFYRNGLELK